MKAMLLRKFCPAQGSAVLHTLNKIVIIVGAPVPAPAGFSLLWLVYQVQPAIGKGLGNRAGAGAPERRLVRNLKSDQIYYIL
jgi:hypothetical protein